MRDFCSTHIFSMKNADKSANFAAGGITNHGTHHSSFRRDKNKHWVTSYVMVYKAMWRVTLPRMPKLSPTPTLVT
jgi:hypothetical protein